VNYPVFEWQDEDGDQIRVIQTEVLIRGRRQPDTSTYLPTRVVYLPDDHVKRHELVEAIYGEPVTVIRDSELPTDGFDLQSRAKYYEKDTSAEDHWKQARTQLALAKYKERQLAEKSAYDEKVSEFRNIFLDYAHEDWRAISEERRQHWRKRYEKAKELLND
jgi:hypothetical protein